MAGTNQADPKKETEETEDLGLQDGPDAPSVTGDLSPLETRNVALDTQTIYAENFKYNSRRLTELKERVRQGQLKVFMTDINQREVRAGIRKRVSEAAEALAPVRKKARILSNVAAEYPLLFDKARQQDTVDLLAAQFDQFLIDAEVEMISSRHLPLGPIFDRYFETRAPFEPNEEKKSEFPDAASIAALIDWSGRTGEKIYYVTGDAGVRLAAKESPRVIPVASLAEFLARATATYEERRVREVAVAVFEKLQVEFPVAVETEFSDVEVAWRDYDYGNPDVRSVSVRKVTLSPAFLTDVNETTAQFELEALIEYDAELRYDDPESVVYDREDDEVHVFNRIHADAKGRVIVPVGLTIEFDAATRDGQLVNVELNEGQEVALVPDEIVPTTSDVDQEWEHSTYKRRS